jgi:hypothetical protein
MASRFSLSSKLEDESKAKLFTCSELVEISCMFCHDFCFASQQKSRQNPHFIYKNNTPILDYT